MSDEPVPRIPRDVLFGNPERVSPSLSPDGTRLGFVAPVDGVLNVWVGPAEDVSAAVPVTHDHGHGVRVFAFAHDDRTLLYLRDTDGDEDWRLYTLDLETGESTLRTPDQGVTAEILAHNRWYPNTVLLGLNADNPQLHDVHSLDLRTGVVSLVERNPGFASWIIDADLRIRGGTAVTPDGGAVVALRVEREADQSAEYQQWLTIPPEDVNTTGVLGYTRDGTGLLVMTSVGRNTSRLIRVDVASGTETEVAGDDAYDLGDVALDPETLEPVAAVFVRERNNWTCLDEAFAAELAHLQEQLSGELSISRRQRDDRVWLVSDSPSDGPVRYYRYERDTRSLTLLFVHKPALEQYRLAAMEPFSYTARDGLVIHGYLTFPPGATRTGLPAVLDVHGGPWVRDVWGYDPEVQWMANRGYLAVQVNYRGSTGYGKSFGNAGDKEWGRAMHDDLVDAVEHLVGEGIVDAGRVAIFGGSYGGYAALVGAAFTPEVFRCAVDIVGPSNLLTLLESVPEYWKPMIAMMHAKVGDPKTEAGMLWARSPLSRADDIAIPILIAQGRQDPRVKVAESEQIVAALAEKGLPHEYLLFEDEGHGLARPENRETFYAAAERFLAKHLA